MLTQYAHCANGTWYPAPLRTFNLWNLHHKTLMEAYSQLPSQCTMQNAQRIIVGGGIANYTAKSLHNSLAQLRLRAPMKELSFKVFPTF